MHHDVGFHSRRNGGIYDRTTFLGLIFFGGAILFYFLKGGEDAIA